MPVPGRFIPSCSRKTEVIQISPSSTKLSLLIASEHFFIFGVLGFELRALHLLGRQSSTWPTPPALFCVGYFWDRVSRTICLGWLQTEILLISASWVPRVTGVSHLHLTCEHFWLQLNSVASWLPKNSGFLGFSHFIFLSSFHTRP
jgi:hypothetical protein